jgi:two-component system, chemotaxis family, chemotaxis protein CheY
MVKILIVDDAFFVRVKLKNLLESNGYDVVEAENGKLAIETYEKEKPDLILLDITMPEMDGLAALKRFHEMDPAIKVVMLTGVGEQSVLMEALSNGAKNFLIKPVDEDKVLDVIKTQTS